MKHEKSKGTAKGSKSLTFGIRKAFFIPFCSKSWLKLSCLTYTRESLTRKY